MNTSRRLVCLCGAPPILKISWTNDNPGRRFFCCRHYGVCIVTPFLLFIWQVRIMQFHFFNLILWMQSSFQNSCKFFDWYDPEFLTQANIVILGLLKKTNKQEEQLKCKWILKLILGISLICNVILFFYLVCHWIFF